MNFGRAKTILIFLFALLNIFLVCYMFFTSGDNTTPNSKTIENTTAILNERNVFLDKSVNISKVETINYLNLKGITADENVIASKLLGAFTVKDGVYTGDTSSLKITNGEFEWTVSDSHSFKKSDQSEISKYCEAFLKNHEVSPSDLKLELFETTKDGYKLTYHHYFLDKEIFNLDTEFYVNKSGIYLVKGNIFTLSSISQSEANTSNPINVLIKYSAEKEKSEKVEIKEINAGYYSQNSPKDFKELSAQPCYEIILKDGRKLYFDAISAQMIK